MNRLINRRTLIVGAGTVALGGCDLISSPDRGQRGDTPAGKADVQLGLGSEESFQQAIARPPSQLAPEYPPSAISAVFKPNGSIDPKDPDYKKLVAENFQSYKLEVGGLVDAPGSFSLADLRAMQQHTQITRHDCVEGWSCIGQWTGVLLKDVLTLVKPKEAARFVVFHCYDRYNTDYTTETVSTMDPSQNPVFYGSIGMREAVQPQTLLAYGFNNKPLPVEHGAPIRLRVARQLGYKNTKYIRTIELVSNFTDIEGGKGGYWEDNGYEWYGGI